MFCKKCGKEIDDNSNFCSYCGQNVSSSKVIDNKESQVPELITVTKSKKSTTPGKEIYEKKDVLFTENKKMLPIGIVLLLVSAFLWTIGLLEGEAFIIFFVVIIVLAFWVASIAVRMGRNFFGWGLLTLFLPFISLIIFGTLNKKIYPPDYSRYSDEKKSNYLNDYASRLAKSDYLDHAEYFINKAILVNPNNHYAFDTKGDINYFRRNYESALEDYSTSINMDGTFGRKFYNRGFAKHKLKDINGACEDWEKAIDLGYNLAKDALDKYCKTL